MENKKYYLLSFFFLLSLISSIQAQDYYSFGIMTLDGKVVTKASFDMVDRTGLTTGETHLVVSKGDRKGIIDSNGKLLGKLKYDYVSIYARPLYEVRLNGRCGFLNKKGKEVIPCIYDRYVTTDDQNEWYCMEKGDMRGMVDSLNNIIFPFEYSNIIYDYNNKPTYNIGLAKGEKWAVANRQAEILTPFIYDQLRLCNGGGGLGYRDNTAYLLSSSGEEIYKFEDQYAGTVRDMGYFLQVEDYPQKSVILYKYNGEKINEFPSLVGNIGYFSEGISSVSTIKGTILLDTLGHIKRQISAHVPENRSLYGMTFINGLAVASKNRKSGIIDKEGREVVPFIYNGIDPFWGTGKFAHHFVVKRNPSEVSLLILPNKQPQPEIYYRLFLFDPFFIQGCKLDDPYKKGIISSEGKELTPFIYDEVSSANNYVAVLKLDRKIGFMNVLTGATTDLIFDRWEYPHHGRKCIVVEKDGYKGLIDTDFKMVFDCIYEDIVISSNGKYIVVTNQDEKSAIFDINGKILRPFGKEKIYPFIDDLFIFAV